MRFIINSKGEHHHILEELQCPFGEKSDYIILRDDEITYWQNANNYYKDMRLDVEEMEDWIRENEIFQWRNDERKRKTLDYLRLTLGKMVAWKRQITINKVLDTSTPDITLLYC